MQTNNKLNVNSAPIAKRGRGRPRKLRTAEELAQLEEIKKNRLTLEQKQNLKLKIQKEREAAKLAAGNNQNQSADSDDRCYCKNKQLHAELLKWRNSDPNGIRVQKLINDKLVDTELCNTDEGHEPYAAGTRYFVKINKINDDHYVNKEVKGKVMKTLVKGHNTILLEKAQAHLTDLNQTSFYKESKNYIIHEITDIVRKEGWAFNYDVVEDRNINNVIGENMMKIGRKLSNHSNFRNYSPELKEDMIFFGIHKLIKGLKNYNFKFNNPFAWMTQSFWNSFLTTIYHHYKQLNIRCDLMKKLSIEIQTFNGMDPRSSLNRAIKQFLGDEFDINS